MKDLTAPEPCDRCDKLMKFQYFGQRHNASDYDTVEWHYRYYWCPGCKMGYLVTLDDSEITNDMIIKRVT